MEFDYLAILIFFLFALFVPISFLLTSQMLRPRSRYNKVKNAPYESAEESIGTGRDIQNEYLPYFALFLPFEIIAIIALLWAVGARFMSLASNVLVLGLVVSAMVLALVGYGFAGDKSV